MKKTFIDLFLKKVNSTDGPKETKLVKAKPFSSDHKRDSMDNYLMPHNRLHIEYSGEGRESRNSYIQQLANSMFKVMPAEAMYKGRIDSMRCTKLNRAQEIVRSIAPHCIARAIFSDNNGTQFQIK